MGENSAIQWTHHTFNPWIGCQKVSEGCKHCYMMERDTFVRISRQRGREVNGPDGVRHVTSESYWKQPRTWNTKAAKAGVRYRVFCASLADVFEDARVLDAPRAALFDLVEQTPSLDWLLLTKRIDRVLELVPPHWREQFPDNVWMGTSVENQNRADERIPELVRIPSRVRFLSCEPLLESIDLAPYFCHGATFGLVHWCIIGGESGKNARPFEVLWAEDLIEICRQSGVAPFLKQLGVRPIVPDLTHWTMGYSRLPDRSGYELRPRDSHGGDWNEWPEQLRVRAFPAVQHG